MLKHYTVISLDEHENEVEVDTVKAESHYHAMCKVAEEADENRLILGAFEVTIRGGSVPASIPMFMTPGDDNNSPASAMDLRGNLDFWEEN